MQTPATKPASMGAPLRPAVRERRRRIRHRVHTPAYASLESPAKGTMLDLCAVLDVSEDGMSLQSPVPLEVNRKLSFTLDFSETKSRILAAGVVVWSDRSGRAGVRFEGSLPADAVQSLQEWLFVNALTAVAHHSVAAGANGLNTVRTQYEFEAPAAPDYTGMLAALAAVKREV